MICLIKFQTFRYTNKEISQENFTSKIWDLVKIPLLQQTCCSTKVVDQ